MNNDSTKEADLEIYTKRPRERFSQARIINALKKAAAQRNGAPLGLTARAAQRLNCAESTVRSYIRRYPKIRAVKEEIEAQWFALADAIFAHANAEYRSRQSSLDPTNLKLLTDRWRKNLENLK